MTSLNPAPDTRERLAGLLLGTAVGDALGLSAENLSPNRIRRWWKGQWKMRFIFGKGMISDDTEHTLMVAQALLSESKDAKKFQRILAWKFRWWLVGLPGGVGLATAKACLKLWLGFPVDRSGVVSAGSGSAMRSAIIGAYFSESLELRREFVLASSRLTHRGWQAETAALAVAECAAFATNAPSPRPSPPMGAREKIDAASINVSTTIAVLENLSAEPEWQKILATMESLLAAEKSVSDFAAALGLEKGISGYALHVVPVAIYAWLRHPDDFRAALIAALDCGGDADTVGAILGGLAGVTGGVRCIPQEWGNAIWEWPRSRSVVERIGDRLAGQRSGGQTMGPIRYFWPGQVLRNLFFLVTVLVHGFRRLLPPY